MQKLIVGCGYLGRRVAAAWLKAGHAVTALTRSSVHAEELSRLGIRPMIGDVCDPATLTGLPAVDTMLFAVGFDRTSGRSQREVYVDGLRNVLNQVASRCNRFIYISSSSVYGQSAGEWVDETSPCEPVQPGGQCCLAAEDLVREFFPVHPDPWPPTFANILRLSGLYGPGRLLSRVESLRAGEPISGRRDAWLNLIHVEDAVSAVLACEQRGLPGEMFLVTDDQPVRRDEYYGLLTKLVGAPWPVYCEDEPSQRGSGGLNKRCSNRKAHVKLDLALAYPSITSGLPNALGPSATAPGDPPAIRTTLPAE